MSRLQKQQQQHQSEFKLDKFGFITNMDRCGNVIDSDSDDDDDDGGNNSNMIHTSSNTINTSTNSINTNDTAASAADETAEPLSRSERRKAQKTNRQWNHVMNNLANDQRRRRNLSKRLKKGVPDSMRGRLWTLLCNVQSRAKPGKYEKLVQKSIANSEDTAANERGSAQMNKLLSARLVNSQSFRVAQETIERDIHRTYPRHSMFHDEENYKGMNGNGSGNRNRKNSGSSSGNRNGTEIALRNLTDQDVTSLIQELDFCSAFSMRPSQHTEKLDRKRNIATAEGGQAALRRVLRAYSVYDREVGYCQGMNFIAGMFLTFVSEEEAFWLLVCVMTEEPCRMRGLFGENMSETHRVLYVAERLIQHFLPKLAKHLDEQSVHITMYATQWLMTQYTSAFQFDLVVRVWDCFLAEGWKVIYRVMLALLQESQQRLLKMNFEEILEYFRELPQLVNGDHIMEVSFGVPLKRSHLNKYAREYTEHQKREQRERQ